MYIQNKVFGVNIKVSSGYSLTQYFPSNSLAVNAKKTSVIKFYLKTTFGAKR